MIFLSQWTLWLGQYGKIYRPDISFMAVVMDTTVMWNVTLCGLVPI